METTLSPRAWREAEKLTLEAAGRLAGHLGRNPRRAWQLWETGEREPRATVVLAIEKASNGRVNAASWGVARAEYLQRTGEPPSKRLAAEEIKRQRAA